MFCFVAPPGRYDPWWWSWGWGKGREYRLVFARPMLPELTREESLAIAAQRWMSMRIRVAPHLDISQPYDPGLFDDDNAMTQADVLVEQGWTNLPLAAIARWERKPCWKTAEEVLRTARRVRV